MIGAIWLHCANRVIHRYMRNVGIDGDKVGGIEISTDLSPIERRVGLACKIAKWMTGV